MRYYFFSRLRTTWKLGKSVGSHLWFNTFCPVKSLRDKCLKSVRISLMNKCRISLVNKCRISLVNKCRISLVNKCRIASVIRHFLEGAFWSNVANYVSCLARSVKSHLLSDTFALIKSDTFVFRKIRHFCFEKSNTFVVRTSDIFGLIEFNTFHENNPSLFIGE